MIESHRRALDADACRTLAQGSRTFAWASRALPRETALRIATLYTFCRRLDDFADGKPADEAREALDRVRRDLLRGASEDHVVGRFLELARTCGIDLAVADQLLDGLLSDLGPVRVDDEEMLLRYGYRVAGTVGLMCCDVFDVRDPVARPFAIDLGIAMQLTNIARDVIEDASLDRVYLPRPWITRNVTPSTIECARLRTRVETRVGMRRVLDLAERYYRSADQGMIFLPPRVRFTALVASRLYEAIGSAIRSQRDAQWGERAVLQTGARLRHTFRATRSFLDISLWRRSGRPPVHDPDLHLAIRGLPGADPSA